MYFWFYPPFLPFSLRTPLFTGVCRREENELSLPLPSLFGSLIYIFGCYGRLKSEKREGHGRGDKNPSRVSTPLYKGFPSKKGRKGRVILILSFLRPAHQIFAISSSTTFNYFIQDYRSVRLVQTLSPTGTDSQSVRSELAVRRDGIIIRKPLRTFYYIKCWKMMVNSKKMHNFAA